MTERPILLFTPTHLIWIIQEKLEELDPEKDMRGGWIFWVIPLAFGLAATALYSFY